jgi:hypothetical protein
MKQHCIILAIILFAASSFAQLGPATEWRKSQGNTYRRSGITSITLKYSRPDVNKREGKIWGDGNVVTYGFSTSSFITNKNHISLESRANENTTISFEHDVHSGRKEYQGWYYGLFMAIWPE